MIVRASALRGAKRAYVLRDTSTVAGRRAAGKQPPKAGRLLTVELTPPVSIDTSGLEPGPYVLAAPTDRNHGTTRRDGVASSGARVWRYVGFRVTP